MAEDFQSACDVAIVGAGPAGIAAADTLQRAGRDCLIFDSGCIAHNISRFPVYMRFFSTVRRLEIRGYPLLCVSDKPTRREYLLYLSRFCRDRNIKLRLYEPVQSVLKTADGFLVHSTATADGQPRQTAAKNVVLAAGAYDKPNPLGCPGEDLPKVSHYFTEVHPYIGSRVLVVGGGNSACETALKLYRAGVEVTLAVRGDNFGFVKYWIKPDVVNRIRENAIRGCFNTTVREIRARTVLLEHKDEEPYEIENDRVLALTGYQPDTALLERCGVRFDPENYRPQYDPDTLETNVPGLFVAGVMAAGNVSAEIFIENSRSHGEKILAAINQ